MVEFLEEIGMSGRDEEGHEMCDVWITGYGVV